MAENETLIRTLAEQKYEHGFTTDVETEVIPVAVVAAIYRD